MHPSKNMPFCCYFSKLFLCTLLDHVSVGEQVFLLYDRPYLMHILLYNLMYISSHLSYNKNNIGLWWISIMNNSLCSKQTNSLCKYIFLNKNIVWNGCASGVAQLVYTCHYWHCCQIMNIFLCTCIQFWYFVILHMYISVQCVLVPSFLRIDAWLITTYTMCRRPFHSCGNWTPSWLHTSAVL